MALYVPKKKPGAARLLYCFHHAGGGPTYLRAMIVPPMRDDFAANEAWRYTEEPPLDVPIAAHGGSTDERARAEDVAAWHLHTSRTFSHRTWPGGHFYLSDIVPSLLDALVAEGA
jgi:surfactin synthase thioesterase subunit